MRVPSGEEIREAARRLRGVAVHTPIVLSERLSRLAGRPVHLKLESLQRTGSFKFRGAFNRLASLTPAERRAGVVACSAGNHAQGVAAAAADLGFSATVVMPASAPVTKVHRAKALGAKVIRRGHTLDEAFEEVDVTVETEDRAHIRRLLRALARSGYAAEPVAPRQEAGPPRLRPVTRSGHGGSWNGQRS